jgi:hypothetical protein
MPLASVCGGMFGDSVSDLVIRASSVFAQGTVASPARLPDSGTPESLLMLTIINASNPLKINQFAANCERK